MLDLITISKKYRDHTVFENVTISFLPKNLYILQGVNGSGKSTLLKIIVGLIYKTSGTLAKTGQIAYLPDKFTMPKLLRVKSYCYFILGGKKARKEYERLISLFQIPNKRIGQLSKGNQQKLGLLQIFSMDADYYILDEPMDGLDDMAKKIVRDKIKEILENGKTVILSLHQKSYFNELNPKIIEIKEGTVNEKKKKKSS